MNEASTAVMHSARTSGLGFALSLMLAVVPLSARAEAEEVEVRVEVVHVSNRGDHVDPALKRMRKAFAKKGLRFSAFRMLDAEKVAVTAEKPIERELPNGRGAKLSLNRIADGTAELLLEVEGVTAVTYALGREGLLYVNAGAFDEGQLVVRVVPVTR